MEKWRDGGELGTLRTRRAAFLLVPAASAVRRLMVPLSYTLPIISSSFAGPYSLTFSARTWGSSSRTRLRCRW